MVTTSAARGGGGGGAGMKMDHLGESLGQQQTSM